MSLTLYVRCSFGAVDTPGRLPILVPVPQVERRPRETLLGRGLTDALAALEARLRREAHPLARDGLKYVPFDFKKVATPLSRRRRPHKKMRSYICAFNLGVSSGV